MLSTFISKTACYIIYLLSFFRVSKKVEEKGYIFYITVINSLDNAVLS